MIPESTFVERAESRRCVIDGTTLATGEAVISTHAAPHLYDPAAAVLDQHVLDDVISASLRVLQSSLAIPTEVRSDIRKFWARILWRREASDACREDVIHNYLYYFWSEVWEDSDCDAFALDEKYIPQGAFTWDPDSPFCQRLGGRFRKDAPVDIVGRSGRTVFLIEVKYDDVDDRAIGQLLRYFEAGRFLCNHVDHLCDLRWVVPVVVARDFPEPQWVALSPPLRELLRVYFFRAEEDRVVLMDGRRQLRAKIAGSRRFSF